MWLYFYWWEDFLLKVVEYMIYCGYFLELLEVMFLIFEGYKIIINKSEYWSIKRLNDFFKMIYL